MLAVSGLTVLNGNERGRETLELRVGDTVGWSQGSGVQAVQG